MKRPSRAEKKARIQRLVEYYRGPMGLVGWTIRYEWYNKRFSDDPNKFGPPDPTSEARAACSAEPEYREMDLAFALDILTLDELEDVVVHEMSHAVAWPQTHMIDELVKHQPPDKRVEEWARITCEQVTTNIQHIVRGAVPPMPEGWMPA